MGTLRGKSDFCLTQMKEHPFAFDPSLVSLPLLRFIFMSPSSSLFWGKHLVPWMSTHTKKPIDFIIVLIQKFAFFSYFSLIDYICGHPKQMVCMYTIFLQTLNITSASYVNKTFFLFICQLHCHLRKKAPFKVANSSGNLDQGRVSKTNIYVGNPQSKSFRKLATKHFMIFAGGLRGLLHKRKKHFLIG